MVLQEILGSLENFPGREVDSLEIEWHETGKRMLHKTTASGRPVVLKMLREKLQLRQNDVVFADESTVIAIAIKPCAVLVIRPADMYQMASACYEIGNKHLPLFYQDGALMVPFEKPLYRMLEAAGFAPEQTTAQLLQPLTTSVAPHPHAGGTSLFSRIMQLTNAGNHE